MRSIRHIKAILLQEYYMTYRSYEVIFDVFIFSFISLLLFGFLSQYLTGGQNSLIGNQLLLGMILWEFIRIVQYSVTVGSLWNIWSRNLSNLFVTPITTVEYLLTHTISGIVKSVLVFVLNAYIMMHFFHFDIFTLGWMLLVYCISLVLFAVSAGLVILGLIFRFGTRIQAFAWGIIPILQPLTATFFPVRILPQPLQYVALVFPSTYIFEAARYALETGATDWWSVGVSFILNIFYIMLSVAFFYYMFQKSLDTGQFARNEG